MKRASSKAKRQAVGRSVPTCCSASSVVDFDINDYVHVKLTHHGRECLLKNYDELAAIYSGKLPWEFKHPKEDADGWSRWQMHDLMDQLGKYVGMGKTLPFETTIRVEIHGQNPSLQGTGHLVDRTLQGVVQPPNPI